jgi:hypothetical protein
MNAVTQDFGDCPCLDKPNWPLTHCNAVGTKLTKYGHLVGCSCPPCRGRRNKRSGQRTEAKRHRRLGGNDGTPTPPDELAYSYSINVTTQDKHGQQIPANFIRFIDLEWTRHALRQAEKKLPVGSDSLPALILDCGRKGMWMVMPVPERGLRI